MLLRLCLLPQPSCAAARAASPVLADTRIVKRHATTHFSRFTSVPPGWLVPASRLAPARGGGRAALGSGLGGLERM
jgi:hypothetical protein